MHGKVNAVIIWFEINKISAVSKIEIDCLEDATDLATTLGCHGEDLDQPYLGECYLWT